MSGLVDAERGTGHHGDAGPGQVGRHLTSHRVAVGGGGAGAHHGDRPPELAIGPRIGISKAADLPWRFADPRSKSVSRPWPAAMRPPSAERRAPSAGS